MIGRWHGEPFRDFKTKKWYITFELDEAPTIFDRLREKVLSIDVKEYRKKRSLDANAYCWAICTKMAEVLKTSKDEVYEDMIQRYAPFDKDEDGYITVTMLARIPVNRLGGHWRLIHQEGDFNSYMRLVGSSEMDTKQMATFLDGVVSEAKELEIETETPEEIERMKQQWGIENIIANR